MEEIGGKESVVVLSTDSRPVDAAYARILKTDTLVITVKEPGRVWEYRPERGVGKDAGSSFFAGRGRAFARQVSFAELRTEERRSLASDRGETRK